jgi:hypothetical protein
MVRDIDICEAFVAHGHQPRLALRGFLLWLLAERSAHGYDLIERGSPRGRCATDRCRVQGAAGYGPGAPGDLSMEIVGPWTGQAHERLNGRELPPQ